MTQDVQLPAGFSAAGITCGIKASGRPDLSVFVSGTNACAAGVFTTNRVFGAPVAVSRSRVPSKRIRAVVVNSGNSNACTGQPGIRDAERMTAETAAALGAEPDQVLVCSTGVIGVPLPMDVISAGLPKVVAACGESASHLHDAATGMMTTDTFPKLVSLDREVAGGAIRISGVAKGAAMIAPNMATMLSVIMTDAVLSPEQCDQLLRHAVDRSFNCISVDGHMSTSDTVLLLANGASGISLYESDLHRLQDSLDEVCRKLATDIIRDAEGADHFITIRVEGLADRAAAYRIAREVADSALVKTAITGADPNWGRIVSAAGYAGVAFDPSLLSLQINGTTVYQNGVPAEFDEAAVSAEMKKNRNVELLLDFSDGDADSEPVTFWTSDLTAEYVRLNSEYTT